MAKLDAVSGSGYSYLDVNFSDIFLKGDIVRGYTTTSQLHVGFDDGSYGVFLGSFRLDRKLVPVSGTVFGYGIGVGTVIEFTITGVSFPVADLIAAARTEGQADDFLLYRDVLSGADTLLGGRFADRLDGFDGHDVLSAGGGNDQIFGGRGDDSIYGAAGSDILSGGLGRDLFVFLTLADSGLRGSDVIRDFESGQDRINLARLDADTDGTAGDQAFSFIGARKFSGVDGQLRLSATGIEGDVNGDRIADFAISIAGDTPVLGDFIL